MKHNYILKRRRDVKTVYLVISSITDPNIVREGRAGGEKRNKSVGDLKVVVQMLISAAVKKNYEQIVFRAEVRVLEKLGKK